MIYPSSNPNSNPLGGSRSAEASAPHSPGAARFGDASPKNTSSRKVSFDQSDNPVVLLRPIRQLNGVASTNQTTLWRWSDQSDNSVVLVRPIRQLSGVASTNQTTQWYWFDQSDNPVMLHEFHDTLVLRLESLVSNAREGVEIADTTHHPNKSDYSVEYFRSLQRA